MAARLGRAYIPDRGAARTLALVTVIDSTGTGLFLVGATIFFIRSLGLTAAQVGLGLSIGGAVGFATTVPLGVLGDKLGPRRMLVLLQLWRAACLVSLVFVSNVVSFTVVVSLNAIAEAATPSLTQAVAASTVDDDNRVRNMAILRSTRNVGFSVGTLLAAPLIAVGSAWAYRAIMLGDALSFAIAALILARIGLRRTAAVRRRAGFLTVLASFRDWRYAALAALNSVFTLHMTILALGIPLWLIQATSAPAGLVAPLLLLNTIMAVILQVPFSKHADGPGGASRVLRLGGVMLAGCSVLMAAAAHVESWVAVVLLVLATALMSLGEIWQAAGAWELSYRYADPERQVQYLAVFSLGVAAQEVLGPVLLTTAVIGAGTAGWLGLTALFLGATLLVGPVTTALQRASGNVRSSGVVSTRPSVGMASASHALEPLSSDPVTEKIPIVPNAARAHESDTMASHRRRLRLLGAGHPSTLSWRVNLATIYWDAGRVAEAIPLLEQTLVAWERLLGADHPSTLALRNNLATTYRDAGRVAEAIPLHERTLAAACEAGASPPGETSEPDGRHPPPDRPMAATGSRPRRRGLLRPRWLAALAALILIAAGTGTWVLARSSGSHAHGTAMPSMPAKKKPPASALMNALILANRSGDAKGDLPPSTCTQQGATKVTCTAPAPGIGTVVFRTYPSLAALYDAYVAQVQTLNTGQFPANFQDCSTHQTFGEVAWNHQFQHPKIYSVEQMSSGMVPDAQAAGRVFCNFNYGQENMVWTQDDGHLLAYVAGPVHEDVWTWWVAVHHNIGFGRAAVGM